MNCDIVLAGVGGQGVLSLAAVIAGILAVPHGWFGALVPVPAIAIATDEGADLSQMPGWLGVAGGCQDLLLTRQIPVWNPFWEHLGLIVDVAELAQPGVLLGQVWAEIENNITPYIYVDSVQLNVSQPTHTFDYFKPKGKRKAGGYMRTPRSRYRLRKAEERNHILLGLLIGVSTAVLLGYLITWLAWDGGHVLLLFTLLAKAALPIECGQLRRIR